MAAKWGNPIDAKREEICTYLEREGILHSLTSVLVSLYEEPERLKDGLIYLKNNFARGTNAFQNKEELEKVKVRNASLLEKIETLEKQNADLEKELQTMKQMKEAEETSMSEAKNEVVEEEEEEESQDKMESEEAAATSLKYVYIYI
nr:c-Myc-binding protein-like [Lepeophtheirus salmonis]